MASEASSKSPVPPEKLFMVDDPKTIHNEQLPPVWTYIVGIIIVVGHGWFLRVLENDYTEKYFQKDSDAKVKDYVTVWIPIFLGSIALEAGYSYVRKNNLYRIGDMISSVACGSLLTLIKKLFSQTVFALGTYSIIWNSWGKSIQADYFPQWLQDSAVAQWWIMFVLVEFVYYWVHRTGHTMNFFWAMHSIHHSSEEYNLSTALRQSSLHHFGSWLYYVPVAFFFDPALFNLQNQFNLLYQYWIHTRTIGKLGFFEYFLNTPSQHRVHHGRNAYCIDKNYGGTLCIFDRLFGTFQEEIDEVPVVYGLTHSINSFDPVEANIHPWRPIWHNIQTLPGLYNKFLVLWNGPGWIPGSHPHEEYGIPPCTRRSTQQYDPQLSRPLKFLLVVQFIVTVAAFEYAGERMNETYGGSSTTAYVVAVLIALWSALAIHAMGSLCDRSPSSISVQILSTVLGAILFDIEFWLRYNSLANPSDEAFQTLLYKAIAVEALAAFMIATILSNSKEIQKPISEQEIGKDFDFAAEAEKLQWLYVPDSHKKTE